MWMADVIEKFYAAKNFNSSFPIEDGFHMWMIPIGRYKVYPDDGRWHYSAYSTLTGGAKFGYSDIREPVGVGATTLPQFWRLLIRMILPNPPEDGLVPQRVQLWLPTRKDWTQRYPAGDFFQDFEEGEWVGLKVAKEVMWGQYSGSGRAWNPNQTDLEPFRNWMSGATWFSPSGMLTGGQGDDEKRGDWSWGLGDGFPNEQDVSDPIFFSQYFGDFHYYGDSGAHYTWPWLRCDFRDYSLKSGMNGGDDITIMMLDRFENEYDEDERGYDPVLGVAWNSWPKRALMPIYTPFNTELPDDGSGQDFIAYPNTYDFTHDPAPIDAMIDGKNYGTPRPLLYIKWTKQKSGPVELDPPTELTSEGIDDSYSEQLFKWSKPNKTENFDSYRLYLSSGLTSQPNIDGTPSFRTSDPDEFESIVPVPSDRGLAQVVAYASGIGLVRSVSNVSKWYIPPVAYSPRIYNENGHDGVSSPFNVGEKVFMATSGYDAYRINTANVIGITENSVRLETDESGLLSVGDMIILDDGTNSYARRVTDIYDDTGIVHFTPERDINLNILDTKVYKILGPPEELIMYPGDESYIKVRNKENEFYRLNNEIGMRGVYANSFRAEGLETGDMICFMDGLNPLLARIVDVKSGRIQFTRFGEGWWTDRSITSFSDYGGGKVEANVTGSHFLVVGDSIEISGTSNYDGVYTVEDVSAFNTFTFAHAFAGTETGTLTSGRRLSEGISFYKVNYHIFSKRGNAYGISSRCVGSDNRKSGIASDGINREIVSPPPIAGVISDRKFVQAMVPSAMRLFFHSTVFFSRDFGLSDGRWYYYKGYDPAFPPPDPPGNGWVEVFNPYTTFGWMDYAIGTITQISSFAGGEIQITTAFTHGLKAGDIVTISGTQSYDGDYEIVSTWGADKFNVVATFVADEPGNYKIFHGERNVGVKAYDGVNFSDTVVETIILCGEVKYNFYDIIDLDDPLQLNDGWRNEDVPGGRHTTVRQGLDGTVNADSPLEVLQTITLSGRSMTNTATHPIPRVHQWAQDEGIEDLPNDFLTLKYLETHRALSKIKVEEKEVYGLITNLPRTREFGMKQMRDFRFSFTVLGE
jgi:hypothetical protein